MAEGNLMHTVGRILEALGSHAFQEIGLIYGVQEEIRKLKDCVDTVKAVLHDAEEQHNRKNHEVTVWLRRLKDAFYEADDLLDDFSTEFFRRKMIGMIKEVRIFFSKNNQLAYGRNVGHKIKTIRERLDAIRNDRQFHHKENRDRTPVENTVRQTHSFVRVEEVIGRDNDKNQIIDLLLESNGEENVSVIPIVGIAGLGKTAIAQLVYNDEKVKNHFDLRMWVCVSDVFNVMTIVEKIIRSATNRESEKLDLDQLQERLRKEVDEKKYLLVLDDVWNENRDRWLELEKLLRNDVRGSKIIVTTRSEHVAKVTSSLPFHVLRGLSEDMSWSLFMQMAFEQGLEPEGSKLVHIGKDIVAKCVGVPLAIRTIGRLLYYNNSEAYWLRFRDGELSKIAQEETDILPKLKLSYDHLPSHLKQCFAYCALFPKDYEIQKEQLIFIWMAEGFLQLANENQCPEDVGNEYFMSLLSRSFFQDVEYDEWGNIIKCKIHDLMHDLAELVAGTECTKAKLDARNVDERTHHISFVPDLGSSWEFPTALLRAKHLRSFLMPVYSRYESKLNESNCNKILSNFKRLRTLDLSKSEIKMVPSYIGKLKHLRYLNLSHNREMKKLPNSVLRLLNLQTLDVSFCDKLEKFPKDIREMVNLRHLMIDFCISLTDMPNGIGQLTSLRTLPLFLVGRRTELSQLNELNHLSGNLRIANLGHKQNSTYANLEAKEYLHSLTLEWDLNKKNANVNDEKALLEGLKPHPNLKQLAIRWFGGVKLSSWLSSLATLTTIYISSCSKCQDIPLLDQLLSLKSLSLLNLPALEYIDSSSSSIPSRTIFPSLHELKIITCPELKGWWKVYDEQSSTQLVEPLPAFPCLSTLLIDGCPKLISMPLYPSLEDLFLRCTSSKPLQQTIMLTTNAAPPFSKLKSLTIGGIDEIEFSPEDWLQNLSSLVDIHISSCQKLTSQLYQGIEHFTSLENMKIDSCEEIKLDDEDDNQGKWQGLKSLRFLEFNKVATLVSLPQWLQNVSTLQSIQISNCPTMKDLPDGLQLQSLEIIRCPELSERCGNNTSVDWPKIAHIPNIKIDFKWIQFKGEYQLNGQAGSSSRLTETAGS